MEEKKDRTRAKREKSGFVSRERWREKERACALRLVRRHRIRLREGPTAPSVRETNRGALPSGRVYFTAPWPV